MALFADVDDDPLSSDNFDPFANSLPSKNKTANITKTSSSSLFDDGGDGDDLFKAKKKEETCTSSLFDDDDNSDALVKSESIDGKKRETNNTDLG